MCTNGEHFINYKESDCIGNLGTISYRDQWSAAPGSRAAVCRIRRSNRRCRTSAARINAYELRARRDWAPKPRRAQRPRACAPEKQFRRINSKKYLTKKLLSIKSGYKKKAVRMNNVELYQKNNKLQKRDALQCLEEYTDRIVWRNCERVLDIGCGDGGVTVDILRKFIPAGFKTLLGCDINEQMVKHANEHHGDARTTFTVLDIEGDIPQDHRNSFDHAFSFYTMHWIVNQKRAFTNIYNLLTQDGSCLLIFLGHMPMYDVYRALAMKPKWKYWLKDIDRFVSPYHDSQDPEREITSMMAEIGFKDITVQQKHLRYKFTRLQDCKKSVAAVNPFKMPTHIEEEFFEDYISVLREMGYINGVKNLDGPVHIDFSYTLITVYGSKSRDHRLMRYK